MGQRCCEFSQFLFLNFFTVFSEFIIFAISTSCVRGDMTSNREFNRTFSGLTEVPRDIPEGAVKVFLYNNSITRLKADSFCHLSECTLLDLDNNSISEVELRAFKGLEKMKVLGLCGNELKILTTEMFEGLHKVKHLYLYSNKLRDIENGTFNGLTNLKKLILYKNELTEFKRKLSVFSNRINRLEAGTLNGLHNLQILKIQNNELTALTVDMFQGLPLLQYLDASTNKIIKIEDGGSSCSSFYYLLRHK